MRAPVRTVTTLLLAGLLFSACGSVTASSRLDKWTRLAIIGSGADITCPSSTDCWVTSSSDGLLHTLDGGHSWRRMYVNTGSPVQVEAIDCPTTLRCVGTGAYESSGSQSTEFLATNDGGKTWFGQDSYFSGYAGGVNCVNSSFCYGATLNSWYTTTNGGQTWWTSPTLSSNVLLGPLQCTSEKNCLMVVQIQAPYGNSSSLWRSTDGSRSFKPVAKSLPFVLEDLQCFTADSCVGRGVTDVATKVVESHDGGTNWIATKTIASPATAPTFTSIRCISLNRCFLAVTGGDLSYPFTYLTHDGFKTVTKERLPFGTGIINKIVCPSPSVCFAVGQTSDLRGEIFRFASTS